MLAEKCGNSVPYLNASFCLLCISPFLSSLHLGPSDHPERHHPQFVYEVLDHSVDLLRTHAQASVTWCHGDAAMRMTTVRPMCPKHGTLNDVYLAAREMLIKEGVAVPPVGARIRVLDIESNAVRRTWPLTTSGAEVWEWHRGYSNPSKRIRMEAVPDDQLAYTDNQVLWCHSFRYSIVFRMEGQQ